MLDRIDKMLANFDENIIDYEIINQVINTIKEKKIVIYPAGANGQLIAKTLKLHAIHVEYFVDKAYQDLKIINGINVNNIDKLNDLTNDTIVIIASNLQTQYEFFERNVKELNKAIMIVDGKNLNRILKTPICKKKLEDKEVFDLIECENCGFERKACLIASRYLKTISNHQENCNHYRSVKFDWFGYIISQTCTLKCEHCCEQVPFQKDKGFSSVEMIIDDVSRLAKSSKFLNFVELVGGEPFLHPEIERLITELLKIENIGYIKSFTNGTVIPSDQLCEIMKDSRFMLQVSNYEKSATTKLLKNIYKTKEKLDKFGVKYIFTKNFEWLDFTSFKKHEATQEYLNNAFDKCFLKNCHRVYKGKLYRCPHQYAGIELGKLEEYTNECVNIHSIEENNLGEVLESFEKLEYIDACRFCDLAFDAKPVPAGKQIK